MRASVEILSGIVRVGPEHNQYGDPYDFAVGFSSVDGKTAVVKALVTDDRPGTPSHLKAVVSALKEKGLTATWERKKSK